MYGSVIIAYYALVALAATQSSEFKSAISHAPVPSTVAETNPSALRTTITYSYQDDYTYLPSTGRPRQCNAAQYSMPTQVLTTAASSGISAGAYTSGVTGLWNRTSTRNGLGPSPTRESLARPESQTASSGVRAISTVSAVAPLLVGACFWWFEMF